MNDDKPTFSPDRPMYDTPNRSALHSLHQPEHLYVKEPCPECQSKQAEIDALRDSIEALHDCVSGKRFDDANVAELLNGAMKIPNSSRALRETKP